MKGENACKSDAQIWTPHPVTRIDWYLSDFGHPASGTKSTPGTFSVTVGFSITGSMNMARDGHTAALLGNGQVLVAEGENDTTGSRKCRVV